MTHRVAVTAVAVVAIATNLHALIGAVGWLPDPILAASFILIGLGASSLLLVSRRWASLW